MRVKINIQFTNINYKTLLIVSVFLKYKSSFKSIMDASLIKNSNSICELSGFLISAIAISLEPDPLPNHSSLLDKADDHHTTSELRV